MILVVDYLTTYVIFGGMDAPSPIERAIRSAGSEAKLAAAAGYSQPAINKAKHKGAVSAEMAVRIERAVGGAVSKEELRPDLYGEAV